MIDAENKMARPRGLTDPLKSLENSPNHVAPLTAENIGKFPRQRRTSLTARVGALSLNTGRPVEVRHG